MIERFTMPTKYCGDMEFRVFDNGNLRVGPSSNEFHVQGRNVSIKRLESHSSVWVRSENGDIVTHFYVTPLVGRRVGVELARTRFDFVAE